MLEIEHIWAAYHPGYKIFDDISLQIPDASRVVILGRNGAGKTTLANSVFGLVPYLEGKIAYNGEDIRRMPLERIRRAGISYFMQGGPVFPQMSVRDNLLMASGRMSRSTFDSRLDQFRDLLPLFAEAGASRMAAGSLSGGERTQLAIAMAVITEPSLLILDEPFAGLSPSNARVVLQVLEGYQKASGAAMMVIAQDISLASAFSATQYVIHEGRLLKKSV